MDQNQQQFFQFIMDRVQNGKQDEARVLLSESFGKMATGNMDAAFLSEFSTKLESLLKPEAIEEFKNIASQFGSQL